jgi:hypothetical protein
MGASSLTGEVKRGLYDDAGVSRCGGFAYHAASVAESAERFTGNPAGEDERWTHGIRSRHKHEET